METTKSKELTELYFNRTAADYDNSHDGKFVRCMYQEILDRAGSIKGNHILDLGCGNGNVIELLKSRREADYYGLDLSEKMIEEAEKRFQGQVHLAVGDAEGLPYENNTFDLIICNASFHHYTHPEKAVEEIKRVLKPGGTLILGDPTLPGRLLTKILSFFLKYSNSGDAKIWHKKDITKLFEHHGFAVEKWNYINHHSFMFNAVLSSSR